MALSYKTWMLCAQGLLWLGHVFYQIPPAHKASTRGWKRAKKRFATVQQQLCPVPPWCDNGMKRCAVQNSKNKVHRESLVCFGTNILKP